MREKVSRLVLVASVAISLYPNRHGLAQCGVPTAILLINNGAIAFPNYITVCRSGKMIVTATRSKCATSYFLSIQLSDSHGNAAGTEFGEWLGKEQYDSFGYISAFDLKAWAEAHYLHFTPGQFYRVKLGIGPYRRETTQLLFISPPSAQLQINNSIGPLINVPGPLYLMSLNGVSGCAEKYILRMENSDASGSHNGGGFLEILSRHDYDRYGSIGHFNLAKWARERGIPLTAGKYYRVSLETVPTATSEAAVLVHLQ